jgi:hypothetical protein
MTTCLFTLYAHYDTSESKIMSSDEAMLRTFGQDHHRATKIKPYLTLRNPDGEVIASMDIWASEWMEAGQ